MGNSSSSEQSGDEAATQVRHHYYYDAGAGEGEVVAGDATTPTGSPQLCNPQPTSPPPTTEGNEQPGEDCHIIKEDDQASSRHDESSSPPSNPDPFAEDFPLDEDLMGSNNNEASRVGGGGGARGGPPHTRERTKGNKEVQRKGRAMEPITTQPMTQFAMTPMAGQHIPPGLEYLAQLDQVLIQQIISLCELLSGCEAKNKYILKNSMGQKFLTAKEESDFFSRQCCGNIRGFEMPFVDNNGAEVLRISRPLRCNSCCTPCCNQEMEIFSYGQLLGSMHQEWNFWMPMGTTYTVKNASGNRVFTIVAPFCPCSCGSDVVFEVIGSEGNVGTIRRTWKGCFTECFTDADNFCVTFSLHLDVRHKALILGAAFLIDFIYFETNQQ